MKLINIGYGNLLVRERIVSVVSPEAAPIKRMIIDAKESGRAIDASCGKKTRSVIITDSDHVVLCALEPERVLNRFNLESEKEDSEEE
ncbi:MAG: DUF370 domain-containing protein [Ruminococcaceae bacterium]|nr:DUF370 domain-containing protein [Oscillospiraceae bacterium]